MKTEKKASAKPSAKDDSSNPIAMLKGDHKEVKKLFSQFKKIKNKADMDDERAELVAQVCKKLLVHAQLEEEIFYPAVRTAIPDQDLMDEATVEHAGAKDLIAQLMGMRPSDDLYNAKVTVLSESIEHHVKEEEGDMFPQAKKAKVNTAKLGEQMLQRQQELIAEVESGAKAKPAKKSTEKKTSSAQAAAQ